MKEQLNAILQKRWTLPTATGLVGLGVGTFVGYVFTRKQYDRIEAELERIDRQQEIDMKDVMVEAEVNRRLAKELEKRMPLLGYSTETEVDDDEARKHLREDHPSGGSQKRVISNVKINSVDFRTDGGGLPGTGINYAQPLPGDVDVRRELEPDFLIGTSTDVRGTVTPIRTGVITNIFDNGGDEWDYKTEIESRDKSRPYVIHVDEYVGDEMGWDSQSTLTWYEKDQILTDSHDKPIHNPNEVVGLPLAFGHGSNDANVVYVRNEQLQAEYEILRDAGSYQETVLGEQLEAAAEENHLKHSHNMRFRSD